MVAVLINMLGEMDKPKGAPGVAVAAVMEKIAREIVLLYAEGKVEVGGNRVYHETRDSSEMDFTKITIYYQRKWFNFSRVLVDFTLKDGRWIFQIDSACEEPVKSRIKLLFKKYSPELLAKKIKVVFLG